MPEGCTLHMFHALQRRCLGAKHCDEQRVTALSSACLTWLLDEEAFPNGRDLREQLLELRLTERDGRAKL